MHLKRIQKRDGNWIEDKETMAEEVVNFFKELFHEDQVPTAFGIIDHIPSMVDYEQNQELLKQPTIEEVKWIVYGLTRDSAGGPNGFIGFFFHVC